MFNKGVLKQSGPSQAVTRILCQQALEEIFEGSAHVFWPTHWVFND
jgi:hypothetical protein